MVEGGEATAWRITTLLCDSAQVAEGKLYVLGGGWSLCGPGAFVHGLAMKLEVPWGEANRRHVLRAQLLDEDGVAVRAGDPPESLSVVTEFEVGRPPGVPQGSSLDVPMAVNFGPLELPPGRGYVWAFTIDDDPVGGVRFRTRPAS